MSANDDFAQVCLHNTPCGVLSLDEQGTIRQVNPAFEHLLGISADRLLGYNRETLPLRSHKVLFKEESLMHLLGPGLQQERWLQCNQVKSGSGVTKFFQDITELVVLREQNQRLREQIEELTITDELTGLANPRAFNRALDTQVTRSRRYQNSLSLALIELVDESDPQALLSDGVILATSRFLRDRLRWVDTLARWDHNHFLIILPETNAEHACVLIEKISEAFHQVEIPEVNGERQLVLRYGVAQWLKGNDSRILMERAAENLNAAGEQPPVASVT